MREDQTTWETGGHTGNPHCRKWEVQSRKLTWWRTCGTGVGGDKCPPSVHPHGLLQSSGSVLGCTWIQMLMCSPLERTIPERPLEAQTWLMKGGPQFSMCAFNERLRILGGGFLGDGKIWNLYEKRMVFCFLVSSSVLSLCFALY